MTAQQSESAQTGSQFGCTDYIASSSCSELRLVPLHDPEGRKWVLEHCVEKCAIDLDLANAECSDLIRQFQSTTEVGEPLGRSTAGDIETGSPRLRFTRCERPPIDSCPVFCSGINCHWVGLTAGWLIRSNHRRRSSFATCQGGLIQAKPRVSVSLARRQSPTKAIRRFANWYGTLPESTGQLACRAALISPGRRALRLTFFC